MCDKMKKTIRKMSKKHWKHLLKSGKGLKQWPTKRVELSKVIVDGRKYSHKSSRHFVPKKKKTTQTNTETTCKTRKCKSIIHRQNGKQTD